MKEIHIKIIDKMKSLLFLYFCVAMAFSAMASSVSDTYVIPNPQQMVCGDGHFVLRTQASFSCNLTGTDKDDFVSYVSNSPLSLTYKKKGKADITFKLVSPENAKMKEEAYRLKVTKKGIQAEATSASGLFYAFQSIVQLARESGNATYQLPEVTIEDAPRFSYRGMHLDVSRHFYTKEFVKKQIDALARYKLNRFHWHLTDGAGWRIEIKKYPELTQIGAQRKETVIGRNSGKYDGKPYGEGMFYTQDEIRDVIAYAQERFITIIPEIDLPGHQLAAITTYPDLGCTGGPYEVWTQWGVSDDVICAGNEKAMTFLEDVLGEVIDLFPSEYIHVGGDECPKVRWKSCPKCQARAKALGLKSDKEHSKEERLQSFIINHIEKFLNAHGRQIIGWDEILEGGLAPNATVMSWRGEKGGIEAAKQKHDVIMTPNTYLYFDYYQAKDVDNEPFGIGGYLPLERVYSYEPMPASLTPEEQKYIKGVQANLWTEYIATFPHAQYPCHNSGPQ